MATPPPFPWTNTDDDWYAALESGGRTYGLACRRAEGEAYEVFVPETGEWIFTSEGAGYFTGIGGVTDAEPVTPEVAAEIERTLRNALPSRTRPTHEAATVGPDVLDGRERQV